MKKDENETLSEMAYDKLREMILQFELLPNEVLSDFTLAKTMQISRSPIRQALERLRRHGLVVYDSEKKKLIVAPLTMDLIVQIFEARIAVETAAVKAIIEKNLLDQSRLNMLEELNNKLSLSFKEKDYQKSVELDSEFHLMLVKLSENTYLDMLYKTLINQNIRIKYLTTQDESWHEKTVLDHQEIVNLLKKGEMNAVTKILEEHLSNYQVILFDFERKFVELILKHKKLI